MVILNRSDYEEKLRFIVDNGPYRVVTRNPGAGIRRSLHSTLRKIELDGRISRQQVLEWCPTYFQTPFLFWFAKSTQGRLPFKTGCQPS